MINTIVGRNLQKIFLVFNIVLAGLGAWMLFDVVFSWVSPQDGGREPTVKPGSEVASTRGFLVAPRSLKDYEILPTSDIFRTSPRVNPSQGTPSPDGSKTTSPDLRLKGTILGNDAQAYAVIEDGKTKTQLLYSLNDLVHGVRIIAIEADHVVLSAQGKNEVLMMSEEDEKETVSVSPPTRRFPPGAQGERESRVSRQPAIKPNPLKRIAQDTEQEATPQQDQESPSEGERQGEEGAESDVLTQEKPEDRPLQ
jgi:type II secretion system protein C